MSDTSEETLGSKPQTEKEDGICRDFSRGVCDRKFCKYRHENEIRTLNFCHDFQNNVCPRSNCKFIHCTTEEVEVYKKTGEMSNQIIAEATRKNQIYTGAPTCTRFKKGHCRRAYCKYRHISVEEEEAEIIKLIRNNTQHKQLVFNNNGILESQTIPLVQRNGVHILNGVTLNEVDDCEPPQPKRRLLTQEQDLEVGEIYPPPPNFKGYFTGNPPPPLLSRVGARTLMLEEENSLLRKEIEHLKRQVSDLTATNEFLLDQNAALRVTGKRNGTVGAVSMPSVTITNTNTPQQVIRTVTASVATVPVSLATVSTCNPVSGNPAISIAGMPAVSIAQPTHLLAPSQQILVTTNPTTQLAIANSTPAQLAIAQQNLATNLAAQQAQPQLTSQAQLALATTTQQLTSQAQHMANQQLALATAPQQLTSQPQTLTLTSTPTQQLTLSTPQQLNQQLTNQAQQLANQQLTSQAQQLANQQLTSQAQQLATQQLTSQAQQLATQQLTSQAQQLANQQLTSQAQQLATQQLATQQLTTQAQLASQQLTSQAQQLATQQLTSQAQQLANQQLTSQAQQLATQQLTSQAQQLANQQLTSQAQQLALANTQQLTSQAQQLALANTAQQLTVASVPHSWL